jgi:hypothetical protein
MLLSKKRILEIESMNQLYLQELDQENLFQKFSREIAGHVAKRGTNLQIVGKTHQIKIKRPPNWKKSKNSPEALHLKTSNTSYHCDYCH